MPMIRRINWKQVTYRLSAIHGMVFLYDQKTGKLMQPERSFFIRVSVSIPLNWRSPSAPGKKIFVSGIIPGATRNGQDPNSGHTKPKNSAARKCNLSWKEKKMHSCVFRD